MFNGYIQCWTDRGYLFRWITLKKLKWTDPDGKEVSDQCHSRALFTDMNWTENLGMCGTEDERVVRNRWWAARI
jgi:hypothetical protein